MSVAVLIAVLLWIGVPFVAFLVLDRVEDRADAAARAQREADVRQAILVAAACQDFEAWEQELAA